MTRVRKAQCEVTRAQLLLDVDSSKVPNSSLNTVQVRCSGHNCSSLLHCSIAMSVAPTSPTPSGSPSSGQSRSSPRLHVASLMLTVLTLVLSDVVLGGSPDTFSAMSDLKRVVPALSVNVFHKYINIYIYSNICEFLTCQYSQ